MDIITIDAPKRAEDAAIVPVDLHFKTDAATGRIKAVTLIVDENPSPVAAVFTFRKGCGRNPSCYTVAGQCLFLCQGDRGD